MIRLTLALLFSYSLAVEASAQVVESVPSLTRSGVHAMTAAAEEEADANGWNVVIVVVDAGGHLLALERLDGAPLPTLDVAHQKARTAALYRRSTQAFVDRMAEGDPVVAALPDVMAIAGGLPILVEGTVVGAIGVSGVRPDQDAQIAQAGIDALMSRLR